MVDDEPMELTPEEEKASIDKTQKLLDEAEAIIGAEAKQLDQLRRDELVRKAVIKTAEDIVASVMRKNAESINANIATMIQTLVDDMTKDLNRVVEAAVGKRFDQFKEEIRAMDARDRGNFLRALDELDGSARRGGG